MEAGQFIRDYVLEEKLGFGGVGEVWRARHRHLNKVFALKAIYPHLSNNARLYTRFLQEARAMAALEHPNIVGVHDFFCLNGDCYLVMTYIEGESLQSKIIHKRKTNGFISLNEAFWISKDILAALNYAHRKGIVHRDVKPSNILVRPDSAYLVDFGIALVWGQERITQFGTNIGTPEYMSPEQIQGKEIDHLTDVYSFGCVLYEVLTGQPPFGGREEKGVTEHSIMDGHLNKKPKSIRNINREVDKKTEAVVFRAMAKDPKKRFGGCQDMANALPVPKKEQPPIQRPHTPPSISLKSFWKGKYVQKILISIMGIFVLAIIVAVLWPNSTKRAPTNQCGTVREIARGSVEQMYSCAVTFYKKDRLGDAQLLWEEAWRVGQHGPSSLAIGKMYDPVIWGKVPTTFSKPDAYQAEKWYQRAVQGNVKEARDYLRDLEEWHRSKKAYPDASGKPYVIKPESSLSQTHKSDIILANLVA